MRHAEEFGHIRGVYAAAIEDGRHIGTHRPEHLVQVGMHCADLVWRGRQARSDGPNGLIGHPNLALRQRRKRMSDLMLHPFESTTGFPFLPRFADTHDRNQARFEGTHGFFSHDIIRLSEAFPTLGVADECRMHTARNKHVRGEFAGMRSPPVGGDLLGNPADRGRVVWACRERREIGSRRGNPRFISFLQTGVQCDYKVLRFGQRFVGLPIPDNEFPHFL